jgi:hypothetical protein
MRIMISMDEGDEVKYSRADSHPAPLKEGIDFPPTAAAILSVESDGGGRVTPRTLQIAGVERHLWGGQESLVRASASRNICNPSTMNKPEIKSH